MRIQAIKTNISFLINVINNPTFQAGACYTTFIEETPELFSLSQSPDRVSKILDFLGDKIVNVSKGEKPYFEDRVLPKYDETALVYGAKDEFKKLGAKGFTQKILGEKRLYVTDTSMRDAQQSLIATRMRTKDIVGAAKASNVIFQNAFSVEAWGGATLRHRLSFPEGVSWKRLEILSERMPNTLIQMLLRASNAVGYSNYPDNLVKEFIRISAIKGVDVFRVFDSLNWIENMKMPVEEALKTGKIVEGSPVLHRRHHEPQRGQVHLRLLCGKGQRAGGHGRPHPGHQGHGRPAETLCGPEAGGNPQVRAPHPRSPAHPRHHRCWRRPPSLKAAEAGVDIVDLAIESMSSCTSQPSRHRQEYGYIMRMGSHVFFNGMALGETNKIKIEDGKTLVIKYLGLGDLNEDGTRNVHFELNGMRREVALPDKNAEAQVKHVTLADPSDKSQAGASIPGMVSKICVKSGDAVEENQVLAVIEAMKMETNVVARMAGTVEQVLIKEGGSVKAGELLITIK